VNRHIAGVDEAGRGSLAGPVIAGAVVFNEGDAIEGAFDSKRMSVRSRELMSRKIRTMALDWAIGAATAMEIDKLNIHNATLLAMRRAIIGLRVRVDYAYIDGKFCPDIPIPGEAVVRGDEIIPVISAASILAKVFRDRQMIWIDGLYPCYGFRKHKGYPTEYHRAALKTNGPTPEHRMSYAGVVSDKI
jgi:ribonuclease HII